MLGCVWRVCVWMIVCVFVQVCVFDQHCVVSARPTSHHTSATGLHMKASGPHSTSDHHVASTQHSQHKHPHTEVPPLIPHTLLVTGLVKDAGSTLRSLFSDLSKVACMFQDASFVVLESNSKDDTLDVLKELATQEQIVCPNAAERTLSKPFQSRVVLQGKPYETPHRVYRLVHYRNELREYLLANPISNVDRILMVDFDIYSFDANAFSSRISRYLEEDWDALCFNDNFRDLFAMVTTDGGWAFRPEWRLSPQKAEYSDIQRIMSNYHSGDVMQMKSCFNAATLYKADKYFVDSCEYQNAEDAVRENPSFDAYLSGGDAQICEHVQFHACLADAHSGEYRIGLTKVPNFVVHREQTHLGQLEEEDSENDKLQASYWTMKKWRF